MAFLLHRNSPMTFDHLVRQDSQLATARLAEIKEGSKYLLFVDPNYVGQMQIYQMEAEIARLGVPVSLIVLPRADSGIRFYEVK